MQTWSSNCPEDPNEAGDSDGCMGCPGQAACKAGRAMHAEGNTPSVGTILETRMKGVGQVWMVVSGKGGVGKSTVAAQLAVALKKRGKRVALVDTDLSGPSLARIMQVEGLPVRQESYGWIPPSDPVHKIPVLSMQNLLTSADSPVAWAGPRKTTTIRRFLADTFWGRLDVLIVDTPPGSSDEHIALATALRGRVPLQSVVVTTPQAMALQIAVKQLDFCRKLKIPVAGLLENMSYLVCPCCNAKEPLFADPGLVLATANQCGVPLLASIPMDLSCSDHALSPSPELGSLFVQLTKDLEAAASSNRLLATASN